MRTDRLYAAALWFAMLLIVLGSFACLSVAVGAEAVAPAATKTQQTAPASAGEPAPQGPIIDKIIDRRNDPDRIEKRKNRWQFFGKFRTALRRVFIGAIIIALIAAFVYIRGWFR